MIRWFSLMLLIGAAFGLFAQEAAMASAPARQSSDHVSVAAAMGVDCAEKMGLAKPRPDQPCHGLTLDCIAKMGCVLTFTLTSPLSPALGWDNRSELLAPMPAARLVGRNTPPEPEPPALTG